MKSVDNNSNLNSNKILKLSDSKDSNHNPNIIDVEYHGEPNHKKLIIGLSSILVVLLAIVGILYFNNIINDKTNSSSNSESDLPIAKTIPSETAKKYINKYTDKDYIISTSSTSIINTSSLNDYSMEELFIARNELFARHGYIFKNSPNLQAFFESKTWYTPVPDYTGKLSNDLENNNLDYIKSIEFLKLSYENSSIVDSDYVFPNSDKELLTQDKISSLNDWQLIIAKNELFARYKLKFSNKELNSHFSSKSWYSIDENVTATTITLNEIENTNLNLLLAEENKRSTNVLNHDLGN